MGKTVMFLLVICIIISLMPLGNAETLTLPKYYMPLEDELHEGTWLQWPHDYTYGYGNRKELEDIWIEMTKELTKGENVHIIAYNRTEKKHIKKVLNKANVDMSKVDFYLFKTNDTWIRDNGPIFVYDDQDDLVITNWEFNGWGEKYPYFHDNLIPKKISNAIHVPREDINMVLEGGSIEHDGNGTCMATLTSIVNDNRNPGLTVEDVEEYLTYYLGFTNFIWLDGTISENDVTDCHIDGFVKFLNDEKIVTMNDEDLQYWGLSVKDCATLYNAQNANGIQYDFVYLPLTENNVQGLTYKGSYINYYIGNNVVLVPNYNDTNDSIANDMIQELYPNRTVVGIDVTKLYKYGGMIHCVTQQQPSW